MAKKELNLPALLFYLFLSFLIVIVFVGIDYLIHSLNEEYAVPPRYFPNKILYGTIIGFFVLVIWRKFNTLSKSTIFSLTLGFLLQVRYFLEGYPLDFVLEFLVIHTLILFAVSLVFFRFVESWKITSKF